MRGFWWEEVFVAACLLLLLVLALAARITRDVPMYVPVSLLEKK